LTPLASRLTSCVEPAVMSRTNTSAALASPKTRSLAMLWKTT
jgi:hypothetical protein